jgi:hypothetical protein
MPDPTQPPRRSRSARSCASVATVEVTPLWTASARSEVFFCLHRVRGFFKGTAMPKPPKLTKADLAAVLPPSC